MGWQVDGMAVSSAPGARLISVRGALRDCSGDMTRDRVPRLGVRPLVLWRLPRPWPGSSVMAGAGRTVINSGGARGRGPGGPAGGAPAPPPRPRGAWVPPQG